MKSSVRLPPDPKSIKQHILRVSFQLFEWVKFNERMLPPRDYHDCGWEWDENEKQVIPKSYEGPKTPNFNKKNSIKKRTIDECDFELDADERELNLLYFDSTDEESDSDGSIFEP